MDFPFAERVKLEVLFIFHSDCGTIKIPCSKARISL
jgi:hypothetical protein